MSNEAVRVDELKSRALEGQFERVALNPFGDTFTALLAFGDHALVEFQACQVAAGHNISNDASRTWHDFQRIGRFALIHDTVDQVDLGLMQEPVEFTFEALRDVLLGEFLS